MHKYCSNYGVCLVFGGCEKFRDEIALYRVVEAKNDSRLIN